MPTAADVQKIDLIQYNFYVDGVDSGLLEDGAVSFNINGETVSVNNVEQFSGEIKNWDTGQPVSGSVKWARADFEFVRDIIAQGRFSQRASGAKSALGLGTKRRDVTTDHSVPAFLHPSHLPLSDRSGDIYFHKMHFDLSDLGWVGSRTEHQTLEVPMKTNPDLTQESGFEYCILGSWDLTSTTALSTFFSMKNQVFTPAMHLDALTGKVGQVDQFNLFGMFGDITTDTVTLALNGVGVTASTTTFPFDTLSTANAVQAGDYVIVVTDTGNETCLVDSIVYATSITGTMELVRECAGTDANNDTVTDDAVITLIQDPYFILMTDSVTAVTNSDATKATVGATYGSSTVTSKPLVIEGLAAGPAVVSVTLGGQTTPDMTITIA